MTFSITKKKTIAVLLKKGALCFVETGNGRTPSGVRGCVRKTTAWGAVFTV